MRNTDLKIDMGYGLMTDPAAHDLVAGDTTLQNQALILVSHKGEWKERPMVGCGIGDMANDDDTNAWRRAIREELARDGMRVRSLKIDGENIVIDADYEND